MKTFNDYEYIKNCPICNSQRFALIFYPDVILCSDCRTYFRNPRPSQSEIIKSYDSGVTYDKWVEEEKSRELMWVRRYKMIKKYKKEGYILDVGCGDGHFLVETIEAILCQSFQPVEIIVIDDASTDNSIEIIQKYIKNNKNISLVENKKNMGAIYNTTNYLPHLRGKYLYVMGADDKVLPGLFEKSVDLLEKYPHAGYCCSDSILEYIDEPGYYKRNNTNLGDRPCYISPDKFEYLLKTRNPGFTGQSVVYNKEKLINDVSFYPELIWQNDWFVLYVLGLRYGLCYIPEAMSVARASLNTHYSGRAASQPQIRREIISHMIDLIESPKYIDVSGSFRKSGILCRNNAEVFYVLLRKGKLWKYLNYVLLKRVLFYLFRNLIVLYTPKRIKLLYHKMITIKREMSGL